MKRFIVILLTILFFLLYCSTAVAYLPDVDKLDDYDFDNTDNNIRQASSTVISAFTIILYFVLFLVISFLAYFTTKWLARHQMKSHFKSKYMEVIDHLSLGNGKDIYISNTPQGMLIIGTGEKGMKVLLKIGEREANIIKEAEENFTMGGKNFSNQLENYLNKIKKQTFSRDRGDKHEI